MCTNLPLLGLKAWQNVVLDDLCWEHLPDPDELQHTVYAVSWPHHLHITAIPRLKQERVDHRDLIKEGFEVLHRGD